LTTRKYCAENNGEYAPEICNEFAAELLQKYLKDLNVEGFKLLGYSDEKMKTAIYFTMHFCNWLYHNLFTNERLTLNEDLQSGLL
jgi:hypothetical protein